MTNMSIDYQRACYSLQRLQREIKRTFPGREQNKGFVTGYMDGARAGGFSGHYVDHRGVAYAYDIGVDIEGDGSGLKPADAEWLFNYLESSQNTKFQYAIYNDRIVGNHTGWDMDSYIGQSPHEDHIHISVVDVQWGESSGVPVDITDSNASWGIYEAYNDLRPVKTKVRPIQKDVKTLAGFTEKELRRMMREEADASNKAYVGDRVVHPDADQENPSITVANAVEEILEIVSTEPKK